MRWLHRALSAACVLVALGAYAVAAMAPGTRGGAYLGLHVALAAVSLGVYFTGRALPREEHLVALWCGGVARVLLVLVPPFTTHDVARYLWDGGVALAGFDPYVLAPTASELSALRAIWPLSPEQLELATLYPPLSIGTFAATAILGPAWALWAWKLLVACASTLALWPLWRWARRRRLTQNVSLVALSPLLLLEGGVGAHLDVLAAAALTVALALEDHDWPLGAGAFTGIAAGWKPSALLAMIGLASASPRRARLLIGGCLGFGVPYVLALALGWKPLGSLGEFVQRWRFGSPLWRFVPALSGPHGLELATSLLLTGLVFVVLGARRLGPATMAAWCMATALLLSPVVFPWYLAPLLPAMVARPSPFLIGWSLVAPLTYEVLDRFDLTGTWAPAAWPLVVMMLVWLGTTAAALRRLHPSPPETLRTVHRRRRRLTARSPR